MRETTKLILLLGGLAGCIAIAFTAPIPGPAEVRALANAAGFLAPIAMFCGYALLTALPIPRTVFSLASGLLLGNVLGVVVAMAATMASAVLGYHLARLVGKGLLRRHPAVAHRVLRRVCAGRSARRLPAGEQTRTGGERGGGHNRLTNTPVHSISRLGARREMRATTAF